MTGTSALHLLDDYLETIETLPSEIQQQLQFLKEKDAQLEELQKNLFKKRTVLLKANEKSLDESMIKSLRKRAEKDAARASALLDEKMQLQMNLLKIVEQHQQRLEKEVYRPLELTTDEFYPNGGPLADIPEPNIQIPRGTLSFSNSSTGSLSTSDLQSSPTKAAVPALVVTSSTPSTPPGKISPRKRTSLADEPPTDPNEPTYCYCDQPSYGEMVACDGDECLREWFHYGCVDLASPPTGKWYCKECRACLSE